MHAALYLRVSTRNDQTTDNQRLELEAVAAHRGWQIVEVFEDAGISGAKGRDKRPKFDQMLKAATRGEFDVLMAWSVDRLGRSMQDLVGFLMEIKAANCNLYLHRQALDTTSPSGRAMFRMLGVFAAFEREMIRERVHAGLKRAKARGRKLGRPKLSQARESAIRADLEAGMTARQIMAKHGCGAQIVVRVRKEMRAADQARTSSPERTSAAARGGRGTSRAPIARPGAS